MSKGKASDVMAAGSAMSRSESVARYLHDTWMRERQSQGWRPGPDDAEKKTDSRLLPFDELPEAERQQRERVVSDVLKAVSEIGMDVPGWPAFTGDQAEHQHLADLSADHYTLSELVDYYRGLVSQPDYRLATYVRLAELLLEQGEPLLAYDVAKLAAEADSEHGELWTEKDGESVRLTQVMALALAESGAPERAREALLSLKAAGDADNAETLSLVGRTWKQVALSSDLTAQEKQQAAASALASYAGAARLAQANGDDDGYIYASVNVATLSLLMEDKAAARRVAEQVRDHLLAQEKAGNMSESFWAQASLAEAMLLCGDLEASRATYQKAAAASDGKFRAQASMVRQIRLIGSLSGVDVEPLVSVFCLPDIVVFTGHRPDDTDRPSARFPVSAEPAVTEAIGGCVQALPAVIAYTSAAAGADLIFAEQVLAADGELNIVLPFQRDRFVELSVAPSGDAWVARFDAVMEKASRVYELADFVEAGDAALFDFANRFLVGVALTRSAHTGFRPQGLAVWDGKPSAYAGGAASAIALMCQSGIPARVISPDSGAVEVLGDQGPAVSDDRESLAGPTDVPVMLSFMPMMFADVKGYSKLSDRQLGIFAVKFMGQVSEVLKQFDSDVVIKRTQGDGLFIVFSSISGALHVAEGIRQVVATGDWQGLGLPDDLQIRISLDAGPCQYFREPVTGNLEFCGSYVNRAARIEPITPPGKIYASETFVSLAAQSDTQSFSFSYVGQTPLPKRFGTIPLFHVVKQEQGRSSGR